MADLKISALTASTTPLAGTEVLPIVQSSTTKQVSVANLTAGRAVSMLSGTVTDSIATPVPFNINNNNAGTSAGTRVNFQFNGSTAGYVGNQFDGADFNNLYDSNRFHIFTVGGTEYFRIVNADVTVKTGNLIIGTSGKGIDFSATPGTGTSELLADYEEGTWTPTVTPASGSFTTVTAGTCTYTKVGRIVTVNARFTLTNSGTGTGAMTIDGLPFTIASTYDQNTFSGRIVNSGTPIFGQLVATTTSVDSFQTIAGTTAISNGFIYTFTATYIA
jgi:hypothetical protein